MLKVYKKKKYDAIKITSIYEYFNQYLLRPLKMCQNHWIVKERKATMRMDHTLYLFLTSEIEKAISELVSPSDVDNCKQLWVTI